MKAASATGEPSTVTRTLQFKEKQKEITKWIDPWQRPKAFKMRRGIERGVAHPERHLAVFRQ